MIFELSKKGNPRFSGIYPFLAGLIQAAAEDPWEHYPEGSARLLPPPGDDEELLEDWQELIQPGLRSHFETERLTVADDITRMKQGRGKEPLWLLEIPSNHMEAWLTTLNALRLALACEHCFTEEELAHKNSPDLSSGRGIALMQVNFYAFIQECLVQTLEQDQSAGE